MTLSIRDATQDDIEQMVELSKRKRLSYAEHQPLFWRKSENAEREQTKFFINLVKDAEIISLVQRKDNVIEGFIIAMLKQVPPVYNIEGLNCMVDDFVVRYPNQWETIGKELLDETLIRAKLMGAVQVVVVCGQHDQAKRKLLDSMNLSVASVWYTSHI